MDNVQTIIVEHLNITVTTNNKTGKVARFTTNNSTFLAIFYKFEPASFANISITYIWNNPEFVNILNLPKIPNSNIEIPSHNPIDITNINQNTSDS